MTFPHKPFISIPHSQGLPQQPTLTCPTFPSSDSSSELMFGSFCPYWKAFLCTFGRHSCLGAREVPALPSPPVNTEPKWSLIQSLEPIRFLTMALEQKAQSPYSVPHKQTFLEPQARPHGKQ